MINWHQCNLYFDVNRCDNDGGDCDAILPLVCTTCLVDNSHMRLGDRKCDDDLNNMLCCYDKGDCESLTSCPTCQSFLEVMIISLVVPGSTCTAHLLTLFLME